MISVSTKKGNDHYEGADGYITVWFQSKSVEISIETLNFKFSKGTNPCITNIYK